MGQISVSALGRDEAATKPPGPADWAIQAVTSLLGSLVPFWSFNMKMRALELVCLVVVFTAQSARSEELQDWDLAASDVVRLQPDSFGFLSDEIIDHLKEQGCTIPQTPNPSYPHNVVQGDLDGSGTHDVALLCSVALRSAIMVYWNGSTSNSDVVTNWSDDKRWLQTGTDGIEFSRVLNIASPISIVRFSASHNSEPIVNPGHDGLDEGFQGKASTVHYWDGKTWHRLQGAD